MLKSTYSEEMRWSKEPYPERNSLNFPNLYGYESLEIAKRRIMTLDNVDLCEVNDRVFDHFSKGRRRFFESEDVVEKQLEDELENEDSIDGIIEKKFSKEEILDTKIGIARDLLN